LHLADGFFGDGQKKTTMKTFSTVIKGKSGSFNCDRTCVIDVWTRFRCGIRWSVFHDVITCGRNLMRFAINNNWYI